MVRIPHPRALPLGAVVLGVVAAACTPTPPGSAQATPSRILPAAETPASETTDPRIIAVGDLHGDLENALETLRLAGVIDDQGAWAAGSAVLVQTGDITDRGPDSKALIELLVRLQAEAPEHGGQVVALLGNHEAMNLTGDWRYVHPGDVAAFGGEAERRASFAPDAPIGSWLMARPAAARVGDSVFVHGGIRASYAKEGLERLNQRVRESLTGRGDTAILGPEGPLWFRGYVTGPEAEACAELDTALGHLDARRMVVGHTTRRDGRVQTRCDGKLHVIDIGIGKAYGSHLGAWISETGDARAVYPTQDSDLEDPT